MTIGAAGQALMRVLFRAEERELERTPFRGLVRVPERRLERRLERVVKRGLLKKEDWHLLRALERLDEQRPEREPHRMPLQRVEQESFYALLQWLLRSRERRLHKGPLRVGDLPLPSRGQCSRTDALSDRGHGGQGRSQMSEARSQKCGRSGRRRT